MTWSYLSDAPGSSDRSWVRLMIGDNSSGAAQLQDEELDVLLSDQGSKERAAIAAARAVGGKYGGAARAARAGLLCRAVTHHTWRP